MEAPSQITDYLYLGSQWNACNLRELSKLGITHILNVATESPNFFADQSVFLPFVDALMMFFVAFLAIIGLS